LCIPAVVSNGGVFFESEPNNSFGTADVIVRPSGPFADLGLATLGGGGGDLDFFSLDLVAGEILIATTTPLEEFEIDPDTILGLFGPDETFITSDDDSGPGLGSQIEFPVTESGKYYLVVTGFADFDFVGDHEQDGRYSLSVKVIPAPAAFAALAGVLAVRRRRRD